MKLYSGNEDYKLYHGNMLDMLEVIEPNSIDSIITDPPYGLTSITKRFGKENSVACQYGKDGSFARLTKGFMGKEWDGSGIEYNVDAWRKCYDVLKPGGYLLAFGGSRTFYRIAVAIEDAGFEIRDTICWMYGMGFPKSMNIGKQLEKRLEDEKTKQKTEHDLRLMWERDIQKTMRNEKKQNEVLQSQLQEQSLQISGNTTSDVWREQSCLERWNNIQKTERELQRCKVCEMSKRVYINGKERWLCNGTQVSDGKTIREMFEKSGSCTSYRPQSKQQRDKESNAIQEQCRTQESREVIEYWNKFGTALKPSYEPIIVARKPFKGSLVDNVIEYGVGGINIDDCRVGNEEMKAQVSGKTSRAFQSEATTTAGGMGIDHIGRFPANTILTYDETDFDEVCGGFPNTKSTYNKDNKHETEIHRENKDILKYGYKERIDSSSYNDSGSASRYFYCAKASKRDRDEGIKEYYKVIINKEEYKCEENMVQAQLLKKVIYDLEVENLNILEYGKNIMVIFPKECKSIILTKINKITELKTWNLLIQSHIKDYIVGANCEMKNGGNLVENVDNLKELKQNIINENQGLVHGVSNVVYQMLLKIKNEENWQIATNLHCTVKPTELMQYLVRLVSPNGATILDPFNGSGSTGKAVMYENKERNKNYKYIGIELTEEYLPISKARIEYVSGKQTTEEIKEKSEDENTENGQTTIFDFI